MEWSEVSISDLSKKRERVPYDGYTKYFNYENNFLKLSFFFGSGDFVLTHHTKFSRLRKCDNGNIFNIARVIVAYSLTLKQTYIPQTHINAADVFKAGERVRGGFYDS